MYVLAAELISYTATTINIKNVWYFSFKAIFYSHKELELISESSLIDQKLFCSFPELLL